MKDFDKLWDYDDPEATRGKFIEIEPEIRDDEELHAELLTQISRTYSLQMKFDDAHMVLDKVEKVLKDDYKRASIRYYLERGRTYNSSKIRDKAKDLFIKAYKLSRVSGEDYLTVDSAHMVAIAEDGTESLMWNQKAIEVAESSEDNKARSWLGTLYNNTGWAYYNLGEYDDALKMFEKQFEWFNERKDPKRIMISRWCIGRTLRALGKIQEALSLQKELEEFRSQHGLSEDGYVYEEIAECLLELGETEESIPFFRKSYEHLSQDIWLKSYEPERLERLKKSGALK
ncbi:MAG: tetratricopeptide repeat protein [Ignavibacteria bacterium]|nr:tetratricopeptide repeat protein [Ignavibacteria bacterium]